MKKLLYLLLFIPSILFAQTTVRMSSTATGTNTYSTLFNPNVAAFNSSTIYVIPFTNANTSGTITLDPDGGGPGAAVSIKGDDGNDLAVGVIKAGGTYQFKFNGTLLRMIGSASGGDFWKNVGVTTITGRTAILGSGNSRLHFGMDLSDNIVPLDRFIAHADTMYLGTADNAIAFEGADITVTNTQGGTGFNNSAGLFAATARDDIDLHSTAQTIHLTTNSVSRLQINNNGSWSVNGSTGTSGYVLTTNGSGSTPTWQDPNSPLEIQTVTTTATLDATDFGTLQVLTGTTSDYTVTLPTAVGNDGQSIAFKGSPGLTKVITLDPNGTEEVDGEANYKVATLGTVVIASDGADWVVVNEKASHIPYTVTYTGHSVDPTTTAYYVKEGKNVNVVVIPSGGTSNATTFTLTMPFNAKYTTYFTIFGFNNGTGVNGRAQTTAGSNILTLSASPSVGGGWTASGTKNAFLNFWIEVE